MRHAFSPILVLFRRFSLITQFVRRDVLGRNRGSVLGFGWSFLTPLLMLGIYSFVFVGVFKARWPGIEQGDGFFFAIRVFCGLIIFNFVAEVLTRSPTAIVEQPNLVKKVVFPLEALPVVTVGSALFHWLISTSVLLVGVVFLYGGLPMSALCLPLIFFPLVLLMLGLSWFLAALGVYVRDSGPAMAMFSNLLMFLSPVFYSLSAVPEEARRIMLLLPTTLVIENFRLVLFEGRWPEWSGVFLQWLVGIASLIVGAAFFRASRRGFADVL